MSKYLVIIYRVMSKMVMFSIFRTFIGMYAYLDGINIARGETASELLIFVIRSSPRRHKERESWLGSSGIISFNLFNYTYIYIYYYGLILWLKIGLACSVVYENIHLSRVCWINSSHLLEFESQMNLIVWERELKLTREKWLQNLSLT